MTNAPSNTLVLAGTGKTGSRVAAKLTKLGLSVRTAARYGADVRFDWDDPTMKGAKTLICSERWPRADFGSIGRCCSPLCISPSSPF